MRNYTESNLINLIDKRIAQLHQQNGVTPVRTERVRVWRAVDSIETFDFGAAVRRVESQMKGGK